MSSTISPARQRSIERRIEQVYQLPPMPEIGARVLALRGDFTAGAEQLASIIQLDPSLAAQVIRYASSAYYGYTGRITNVQEAISRVLGFEMVSNLALALCAGRSFRIPNEGPLGLEKFWRRSMRTAILAQQLSARMSTPRRPEPGCAYLCGLLQDFGILLLGHLFAPEFRLLNKMAAANPQTPIPELEERLIGMGAAHDVLAMGHARIGAWLMQVWRMPGEITTTILEHHNHQYRGEYQSLVHLVRLSDWLVRQEKLDEALLADNESLDVCGIGARDAVEVALSVEAAREQVDALAVLVAKAS